MTVPITAVGRYYNKQGGVSNVMAQLATRAASRYRVSIAANEFLDWDEQLEKVPVPMLSRPAWAQIPTFAVAARRRVERKAPQLVHAHDPQYVGADLYTAHSCFKSYIGSQRSAAGPRDRFLSHLYPPHVIGIAMSNLIYQRAPLIIAVSGSIRSEILAEHQVDPARVRVVYNGVDLERFNSSGRREARHALSGEIGVDLSSKLVLIFVGYEFERKRLEVVLRALADAGSGRCHLLVAGGADSTKYRVLSRDLGIEEHVSFLGHRSDIPELLRSSDVFVFPTKYEAASLAILEAAAAGLAVVTSDVAMAGEVFSDGLDAMLVPNQDSHEAVSFCIREMVANMDLVARLGAGAEKLAKKFSWDSIWQEYDQIYTEILDTKRMGQP